ncbi:MAG TPA: TonB-dependent receptor [Steroidobacteraceae bacterium]
MNAATGPVKKTRSPHAAGMLVALLSTPVLAAAQAPSGTALDEIVVTARRTEEPLQKTPVAVTALTMDQLEARSAKDLRDIGRFTPNTYMTNTGGQSPDTIAMFIRGVGLSDHLVTADPGVGLYVDGVYYARADGAVLDFVDVERVEVLRGPQGTLFGKNTAGGAINVISNPPDPNGGGLFSLTAGNTGQFEARGNGSVPLAENPTLGLSGLKKLRGCLARRMYDDACVGSIDRLSGRGYLRWTASPDLTVDVIADTTTGHSHMLPNHPGGYDPNQAFFATYNNLVAAGEIPGGVPYSDTTPGVNPGRYATSGRAPTENPLDAYGVSVNIEYRTGNATLHSITAYRGVSSLAFENGGGGTGAIYDPAVSYSYRKSHWFSQELRIDGAALEDRLAYVGGLYYFGETGVTNDSVGFFAPLQAGWVNFNSQETGSYAVFVHGSYRIFDRLHVSAGIRYTHETKDWNARYAQFSNFASDTFDPNMQARSRQWRGPLQRVECRCHIDLAVAAPGYLDTHHAAIRRRLPGNARSASLRKRRARVALRWLQWPRNFECRHYALRPGVRTHVRDRRESRTPGQTRPHQRDCLLYRLQGSAADGGHMHPFANRRVPDRIGWTRVCTVRDERRNREHLRRRAGIASCALLSSSQYSVRDGTSQARSRHLPSKEIFPARCQVLLLAATTLRPLRDHQKLDARSPVPHNDPSQQDAFSIG